jgi:hypothetical protein
MASAPGTRGLRAVPELDRRRLRTAEISPRNGEEPARASTHARGWRSRPSGQRRQPTARSRPGVAPFGVWRPTDGTLEAGGGALRSVAFDRRHATALGVASGPPPRTAEALFGARTLAGAPALRPARTGGRTDERSSPLRQATASRRPPERSRCLGHTMSRSRYPRREARRKNLLERETWSAAARTTLDGTPDGPRPRSSERSRGPDGTPDGPTPHPSGWSRGPEGTLDGPRPRPSGWSRRPESTLVDPTPRPSGRSRRSGSTLVDLTPRPSGRS